MSSNLKNKVEVIKDFAPIPGMLIETGAILHVSHTRQQALVKLELVKELPQIRKQKTNINIKNK